VGRALGNEKGKAGDDADFVICREGESGRGDLPHVIGILILTLGGLH
jgi:hypothetical protein